jgi:hypothetical protein
MMVAILGIMPLLDRRLRIAVGSGKPARIVPAPAAKPRTSDCLSLGAS